MPWAGQADTKKRVVQGDSFMEFGMPVQDASQRCLIPVEMLLTSLAEPAISFPKLVQQSVTSSSENRLNDVGLNLVTRTTENFDST